MYSVCNVYCYGTLCGILWVIVDVLFSTDEGSGGDRCEESVC